MTPKINTNKTAWVQLYEARRVVVEPQPRSPGRPPGPIPRHKVGMTLSQGEVHEIEEWRERFSEMLQRKISTGETVGILTRICTARMNRISNKLGQPTLTELVEKMIG